VVTCKIVDTLLVLNNFDYISVLTGIKRPQPRDARTGGHEGSGGSHVRSTQRRAAGSVPVGVSTMLIRVLTCGLAKLTAQLDHHRLLPNRRGDAIHEVGHLELE
jgi:hypothetical protein